VSDRGITGLYEWFDRVGLAVERGAIHPEFPEVASQGFVAALVAAAVEAFVNAKLEHTDVSTAFMPPPRSRKVPQLCEGYQNASIEPWPQRWPRRKEQRWTTWSL
jgi:hypothetical protein